MFKSHAKDNTKVARSFTVLYRSSGRHRGDQKSSVPTLDCDVASQLFANQLTSKSLRTRSLLIVNMFSGLTSLCNTPAMCKPVTVCKPSTTDPDAV